MQPYKTTKTIYKDFFIIFLFGLLWKLYFVYRPEIIDRVCLTHPEKCNKSSLFSVDQFSVGRWDQNIDFISYVTQDAVAIIVILFIAAHLFKNIQPRASLILTALKLTVFNGFITESFKSITQRPRPWLYESPPVHADSFGHYNSFVSGHTSFATAMGLWGIAMVLKSNIQSQYKFLINGVFMLLIIITGVFRIYAGRHFTTDVLGGLAVGVFSFTVIYKGYLEKVFSFKRAP